MKYDKWLSSFKENLRNPKSLIFSVITSVILICLICSIGKSDEHSIVKEVKQILEEDIGGNIKIIELYYNANNRGCLVEFETILSHDIAAVHLDTQLVHYNSEFEYYETKFKYATSTTERSKYAKKVLEYTDIVDWKFSVKVNGTNPESGWKQLK